MCAHPSHTFAFFTEGWGKPILVLPTVSILKQQVGNNLYCSRKIITHLAMEHFAGITQSLPICFALAATGGVLEVGATALTALPAVRETEGRSLQPCLYWWTLAGNLGLQAVGSLLSHLFATWYGPISVVVPFFYSATLLSNMFIFGVLLGTEFFSKTMRVGIYVIVVAVILLPLVGPQTQDNQNIIYLFHKWYTILWFTLLLCATTVTGALLVRGIDKCSTRRRFLILLTARAASLSVNLTVSRSFVLSPSQVMLICFLVLKVYSGAVYTYAVIVQAAVVDQARFVPLNTTTIILVNALTGILIWEDWRVIQSWYGYACVFVLLGLGCDLLLTKPLLISDNVMFGTKRRAAALFQRHKGEGYHAIPETNIPDFDLLLDLSDHPSHSFHAMSRKEAWKTVMMPRRERTSTY